MDTYFNTNHKCETCGKCVTACPKNFITMGKFTDFDGEVVKFIEKVCEYTPCHHCDGFWTDDAPCQRACPNGAIELSRW